MPSPQTFPPHLLTFPADFINQGVSVFLRAFMNARSPKAVMPKLTSPVMKRIQYGGYAPIPSIPVLIATLQPKRLVSVPGVTRKKVSHRALRGM